jgi:ATP-dependent Lon protease
LGVTSTIIKAIARLMANYLKQLISSHEHDIQTLQKNKDFYKNQYQALETQCIEERLQHQLQINNINEKFQNQILKDNLQHHNQVNMYQDQFSRLSFAYA